MIATTEQINSGRQNTLTVETPVKRGRGRPRKNLVQDVSPGTLTPVDGGKKEKAKIKVPDLSEIQFPHTIQFRLEPDAFSKFYDKEHDIEIINAYPTLKDFFQIYAPENANAREHSDKAMRFPLAKEIERTFDESPQDTILANRGITFAVQSFRYNPDTKTATLKFTDPNLHSNIDGGGSLSVLNKVQRERLEASASIQDLERGRIRVEIIQGLKNLSDIVTLSHGRNRSKQVKDYSLSNLKGNYNFLKEILESENSLVKGRIGYNEHAQEDINVLDVLALLTLFHPQNEEGVISPSLAYSNRSKLDSFLTREDLSKGYKQLEPIVMDILKLHDTIYAEFEYGYEAAFKGSKTQTRLGRLSGFESKKLAERKYKLPFTSKESNYKIATGYVFPLLNAFRALVHYGETKAQWKTDPFAFWTKHKATLVKVLIQQIKEIGKDSPNATGKSHSVYQTLYQTAKLELLGGK